MYFHICATMHLNRSDQLHFFEAIHISVMIRTSSIWFLQIVLANCRSPGKLKWFINVNAVVNTQDWLAKMDTKYRKGASCVGCLNFFFQSGDTLHIWRSLSNMILVSFYCQKSFSLKFFKPKASEKDTAH